MKQPHTNAFGSTTVMAVAVFAIMGSAGCNHVQTDEMQQTSGGMRPVAQTVFVTNTTPSPAAYNYAQGAQNKTRQKITAKTESVGALNNFAVKVRTPPRDGAEYVDVRTRHERLWTVDGYYFIEHGGEWDGGKLAVRCGYDLQISAGWRRLTGNESAVPTQEGMGGPFAERYSKTVDTMIAGSTEEYLGISSDHNAEVLASIPVGGSITYGSGENFSAWDGIRMNNYYDGPLTVEQVDVVCPYGMSCGEMFMQPTIRYRSGPLPMVLQCGDIYSIGFRCNHEGQQAQVHIATDRGSIILPFMCLPPPAG